MEISIFNQLFFKFCILHVLYSMVASIMLHVNFRKCGADARFGHAPLEDHSTKMVCTRDRTFLKVARKGKASQGVTFQLEKKWLQLEMVIS